MPRIEIDYSQIVIYKIVCLDLEIKDIYVGSTTNFIKRKYQHKLLSGKHTNLKLYDTIYDNGGWEAWEMIEIEKYPCADKNEATKRERFYYELLKANLNSRNPNRKNKEFYQTNKVKIQSKYKEKYICPNCKTEVSCQGYTKHNSSAKHKLNEIQ